MWTIRIMYSLKLHLMEQRLCASLIHVFKDVHFCSEFNLFSFCIVLGSFNLRQRVGDMLFIWCDNHSSQTLIKCSIIIKLSAHSGILCEWEEFHKMITCCLLSGLEVMESFFSNLNYRSRSSSAELIFVIYRISAGLQRRLDRRLTAEF